MALALEKIGTRYEPRTATIDVERARAYAAATNDANPAYASGACAPPVFAVVPTWDAMMVALHDVIPAADQVAMLHAEQDMHFLRPLVPGMTLVTSAQAYGLRTSRMGTRFTMRVTSTDADDGGVVVDQFATMLIRGGTVADNGGEVPPDHAFPAEAKTARVAEETTTVDPDQARRYAEASGDRNPIHLDDEAARAVGLPGVILHGMCTMALCAKGVVDTVAGGDPGRLRRLAVRFYRPVFPGNDLVTAIFAAGSGGGGAGAAGGDPAANGSGPAVYAFEASSGGKVVVRDGRAEVAPAGAAGG